MEKQQMKFYVLYGSKFHNVKKFEMPLLLNGSFETCEDATEFINRMIIGDKKGDKEFFKKWGTKFGIDRKYTVIAKYEW